MGTDKLSTFSRWMWKQPSVSNSRSQHDRTNPLMCITDKYVMLCCQIDIKISFQNENKWWIYDDCATFRLCLSYLVSVKLGITVWIVQNGGSYYLCCAIHFYLILLCWNINYSTKEAWFLDSYDSYTGVKICLLSKAAKRKKEAWRASVTE